MGRILRSNNKKCFECGCVLNYDPDNGRYVCPDRNCGTIYDYSEYRAMMEIGKRPEPLNKKKDIALAPPTVHDPAPEAIPAKECPICDRMLTYPGKVCPACYPIFVSHGRSIPRSRKYRKKHPVRKQHFHDTESTDAGTRRGTPGSLLLESLGLRLSFEIAVVNMHVEKIEPIIHRRAAKGKSK